MTAPAKPPLLLIAAGGTGGHMFPAQALAEEMLARGWRVTLSTDARGARYTGGYPQAVAVTVLASATFARGRPLAKLAVPLTLARGVAGALAAALRDRPAVVVGFGGYPSIPALAAAWLLRLPRLIHEQNGVLGAVNRRFAAHVDAFACGTWPTALPPKVQGLRIGNPVRGAVLAQAGAAYAPPGPEGPLRVLVIGGSQGARILSDAVPAALAQLAPGLRARLQISHQARPEDHDRVVAAYGAAGITAEVQSFFTDVPARLAACHLVLSRSGASSVADIAVIGRPAILIPFAAAAGDHQSANARGLAEAGAALVLREADASPEALAGAVTAVLDDPARALQMASSALATGLPDATKRLAALVETTAKGSQPQ